MVFKVSHILVVILFMQIDSHGGSGATELTREGEGQCRVKWKCSTRFLGGRERGMIIGGRKEER